MHYKILLSILTIVILVLVATLTVIEMQSKVVPVITNFEDCAAAGYPIMESYPEQCRTPDGRIFVRQIAQPMPTQPTCFVGGCSGEICSSEPGAVSICIYKEEYACYKTAKCERQQDGQCGWTQSVELTSCLQGK